MDGFGVYQALSPIGLFAERHPALDSKKASVEAKKGYHDFEKNHAPVKLWSLDTHLADEFQMQFSCAVTALIRI